MLKLAIILLAAWFASQQSMVESAITYVRSDPFLYSSRKGLETCSPSGSVPVLSNSRISIESVLSDAKDDSKSQQPHFFVVVFYQQSKNKVNSLWFGLGPAGLKITFNRSLKKGLSAQDVRQEYTLPSAGTGSLAPTFDSGSKSVPGWLMFIQITVISFVIIDFDSGVVIVGVVVIISFKQPSYNLYVSKKQ